MPLITVHLLTKAIELRLAICSEEAHRFACIVLDLFGFDDFVLDNLLDNNDRRLFYLLEEKGLIRSQREEFVLYDGRTWRIHSWQLQRLTIIEEVKPLLHSVLAPHQKGKTIYTSLPDRLWTMRKQTTT
jgi:hypothetical protein